MSESTAWSLNLGRSIFSAVGERELVHLIATPELHEVPQSPDYCSQVLFWQDRILPVMDLAAAIEGNTIQGGTIYASILAYQNSAGSEVEYGALLLAALPRRVLVDDSQACSLPEKPEAWGKLALSSFSADDQIFPILDLPYIFSRASQNVLGYSAAA